MSHELRSFGRVAPFYDRLMDNVPYRMWTSYLLLLFSKQSVRPRKLLDVCCGTGSMCELLHDEGFEMAGFDISAPMIEQAREKARTSLRSIRYEVADATEVDMGDTYEAAYSYFDSLNYIFEPAKLRSAIHRVAAHIQPGGPFIFDLNTAYAFEQSMFDQQHLKKESPLRYRWRGNWNPETRIIEVGMKFWADGTEFTETHVQRAYADEEVREMLKEAGFGEVEVFHSYTLERPRATSDRVHYAAIKL